MIVSSLRGRLLELWLLSLASAGATGFLLVEFRRDSTAAQVTRAEVQVARACEVIADRYDFYTARGMSDSQPEPQTDDEFRRGLEVVLHTALRVFPGIEGGVWRAGNGSLAYAFPTYEGTGPKTDVPAAELSTIEQLNTEAQAAARPVTFHRVGSAQTLLLYACPLGRETGGDLTAWTMTRVFTKVGQEQTRLVMGLSVLGLTVIGSAILLGRLLYVWSQRLNSIAVALRPGSGMSDLPRLERIGERELDHLVDTLNSVGEQLRAAKVQAAAAERLAAIGQLTAGVAHEIRNPIAAMRLKAENALAGDDARCRRALTTILSQIARLEALLRDLLAVTHRRAPQLRPINVGAFLHERAVAHQDLAEASAVSITVEEHLNSACTMLDPDQLGRALDNLLLNALQHTPRGGSIRVFARRSVEWLQIRVADDGPGVPTALRERLFEPFVSGRSGGTGLGLAVVRQAAEAHGGSAHLVASEAGAVFEIEVPWRLS